MNVTTTCIYCGVGCKLRFKVMDGKIVRAFPSEAGPGEGKLCIKGWSAHEFIYHPDRLKTPLIRDGGEFIEASWDDILDLIAAKFRKIIEEYGSDGIAILSSAKTTNEENYLLQKFTRGVIGTNNIDHCARLCHASTITGLLQTFGSGAMTNSQEDLEETDLIFVIGSNTTEQHPLISRRMIRSVKKGSKLIVADPRDIELTEYADIHLRQRPGTDVPLLNALMNVIINEELLDRDFIARKTENYENLRKIIEKYTPERSSEVTGVPADEIRKAAIMLGKADRAAFFFSMGITQHITGVDNVVSVANLAMLTGNLGEPGTGVNPLRGQNNVQGACDMGALPKYFPGYQQTADKKVIKKFSEAWDVECPVQPGLSLMEMMHECGDSIKAMYIMGENPLMSDPNVNYVREQLEKLDFLVISELFLSETAEIGDVVLPAASFAEKTGTFTATDRRVQLIQQAIPPLWSSRPDWQIITDLSTRMGYPMSYSSSEEIMDEIASLTPIYGGMSYKRLEKEDLRWPCPTYDHPGTRILHRDAFVRGKGKFTPAEYIPADEEPDEEYPLILTTGRILHHWHTGTMTRRSPTLTGQINEAYAEISTKDAEKLGIDDGDMIKVSSRRGTINITALVTDKIKEGVIFIPFHFTESAANKLTNDAFDPQAKIPELKVAAVRINKIA